MCAGAASRTMAAMLPRRALPALLALVLLAVAAPGTRAADVRPVLNGGQLTYEGTAFGKLDLDNDSWRHHETSNLAWSTTYVLDSPYAGSPRLVATDDHWDDPLAWKTDLGDFSGTADLRLHQEAVGHGQSVQRQARTALDTPNPLPPPDDRPGGAFDQAVYGSQDLEWKGACADPDSGRARRRR